MRRITSTLLAALVGLAAEQAAAEAEIAVAAAAERLFARMPSVVTVAQLPGTCGADARVHPVVAYCTSQNAVLLAEDADAGPERDYLLAHAFGHAVQVRHGVADVALQEITRRPSDETMLRGFVERQVDCIAGVILKAAGLPVPDLVSIFPQDPLDRPHWGRNPLSRGPHLEVPVAERALWLERGYEQGIAACAVGEFPADLLIAALRTP